MYSHFWRWPAYPNADEYTLPVSKQKNENNHSQQMVQVVHIENKRKEGSLSKSMSNARIGRRNDTMIHKGKTGQG